MKLYRLADIGVVWVYAQVYEQDLPAIQLGQEATMTLSYLPDRKFRGRVTYVYPTVDEKTRTARVRMEFHNPGYFLKPGMFATVELVSDIAPSALLVPDSAVLRSGEKNTVFVALPGGKFEARTVALGQPAQDDMDQVLGGLSEGECVVASGQFMLDSESQLREAIQKMTSPRGSVAASEREGRRYQWHRLRRIHARDANAPDVTGLCLPHAGACFHHIRSSRQMPDLRHDARAGDTGRTQAASARRQDSLLHLPDAGAQRCAFRQARQMSEVRDDTHSGDGNAGGKIRPSRAWERGA